MRDHTYEFVVMGGGDRNVGIPDAEAEITIKTNCIFEPHDIEDLKEAMALVFDVPKGCVGTKAEWEKHCQEERDEERDAFFEFCAERKIL
jgi:hypothetical protein